MPGTSGTSLECKNVLRFSWGIPLYLCSLTGDSVEECISKQFRKYTHNSSGTLALCCLFVNDNLQYSVTNGIKLIVSTETLINIF